ncbi:hypothetical protein JQC91_10710 [Jannaschia sp. Os4]|uniref:hypothetical protein n=1 Tax=Jannaschia sp. Os4 TaxID=2807617 RepID=UPI0019396214|nr:hypothetical protein [Jannaschia sp. Os4]MBM2576774.1 hypothetical protein [Jannaschia sp. Os4]
MIRRLCLAAAVAAVGPGAVSAQQGTGYDPTGFLEAMVRYRSIARTCESVLPGSPLADSQAISGFFAALGQVEPTGTDGALARITRRLVRSQSASICQDRLTQSALNYGRWAADYEVNKGAEWPSAPRISAGPWCASASCSELTF